MMVIHCICEMKRSGIFVLSLTICIGQGVGVASEKGAPPPVAAKPVNVDIKSLTAKARQDALEQRHQELLSRQKALQEQYQRLQNMQKKNPTAPTNSAITSGGNGNSLTNG